ncbi:protein kinase [Streptomyces luteireticuli]|uniref:protein kinase domain-containing protein n=1 Tax=Streptomyces luteireticuli TaxID=173858 RepID=UPI0035591624
MTDPVEQFTMVVDETIVSSTVVSDRRGSTAWKVTTTAGTYVVKANTETSDGHGRDKEREIEREASVLQRLTALGAIDRTYFAAAKTSPPGARWVAARWIDGDAMWPALAEARDEDTPAARKLLTTVTATLAEALAELHAVRFTHADVQPTNIRVTPDGTGVLLDYALACGPEEHAGRVPYRGALTHTTAPETAAELLATGERVHVQTLPPADVWALGATLFWCWTGERPVTYRDIDAGRAGMLRDIADGDRLHDLATARPWHFPQIEDLITACLADDPSARPTAAAVAQSLARPAAQTKAEQDIRSAI